MNFKKLLFGGLLAMGSLTAVADEGMWVLHKIDPRTQQAMQQLGLQLTSNELYDPESGVSLKDAVVDFGDFCSGVVVSQDGLVFTNHHCGFGAIQALSTPEDDILGNGFVAHSFAEERPAEGLSVFFLQRTDDVTGRVFAELKKKQEQQPEMSDMELREEYLGDIMDEIKASYKDKYPKREVRVQSFYGSSQFFVSVYKEYRDIRLVFTPTQTLGKFGGDTDNWMWPRQTCDFSVFRVYADKNGEPAEYSKDNVPLHPKRWAKVSIDGYAPGDYCMTIGYPGSTSRYLSSYGITERMECQNVPMIEVRGAKQDVWSKWMKSDRTIAIKYASKYAQSSNYWKNSIGMNKALKDLGVVAEKEKLQQRIMQWVAQDEKRKERYDSVLVKLQKGYADRAELYRNVMYMNEAINGMEILDFAQMADRLSLCQDSAQAVHMIQAIEAQKKDYDVRVDKETCVAMLRLISEKVDKKYQPEVIKTIKKDYNGSVEAYVDKLFGTTVVNGKQAERDIILAGKKVQEDMSLKLLEDLSVAFATLVVPLRANNSDITYNENLLTQALLEMDIDQPHYSDANFSMRASYGIIQDYTAGNQHYDYYTNAQSLLDKAAQQDEIDDYKLEGSIIEMLKKGDFGRYADKRTKQMQLCFLSNNDITGGNSGSPMFNGKGELIGLAFDGNWEAMSGDISFDPALQRCIGVDIRFVLYLIDKWGHADNLIKEMGL